MQRFAWSALALVACVVLSPVAWAQQPAPAAGEAPKSDAPAAWADTLKFYGQVEAGITFNPDEPADRRNFGHLFTDHANRPVLNQLLLTAQRPLDPKATDWDFGFKLQGMYGTDARYTHFMGELDRTIKGPYQVDIVEANLKIHAPIIGEGGMDITLGQYPTPLGYEVIDPSANPLYSHSYIFNFGVPFKHTGLLTTTHLTSVIDLYAGIDTGVNAWVGEKGMNNDAFPKGQVGVGLNLLDGNLTVLALSHIGPENAEGATTATGAPIRVNSALRYVNDITIVWKASDALTLTTDLNYIHDDGLHASGGGLAQYAADSVNDWLTVIGRGEIWRDDNGAFVASFQTPFDFTNAQRGLSTLPGHVVGGGKTTYGALTLGLNLKPPVPKAFEGFVIRPEIRYDQSLNGTRPFNDSKMDHQLTIAADFVLPF
jgi:Putative beta-barrel porin-2, OmpL-like. bbp2